MEYRGSKSNRVTNQGIPRRFKLWFVDFLGVTKKDFRVLRNIRKVLISLYSKGQTLHFIHEHSSACEDSYLPVVRLKREKDAELYLVK